MHDVAEVVVRKLTSQENRYTRSRDWNQAHTAGGTCARELAYWRLSPEKALPPEPSLMLVFAHGRWMEREAVAQLGEAGYEVSEQDASFEWSAMRLRGRIDCKIRLDGAKCPTEIKGYAPWSWERLNTIEDFLKSNKEYLRKVPGQLLSYILMDGRSDTSILYLLNKLTGEPKTVTLRLEGETLVWGEAMLKRLETVNAAIAKGELPERIPYEESVCGNCPFRHVCLTEIPAGKGPTVLDPEKEKDLLDLLREREALQAAAKRYEKVDKEIAEAVKGHERIILGDWLITGKEITMPAQQRAGYSYWRKSIVPLKVQKADGDLE